MSRGRGAQPNVLRAIGLDGRDSRAVVAGAARYERAHCTCKSPLVFTIGSYGQTVERCSNARCPQSAPHHPIPDLTGGVRKARQGGTPKKRRAGSALGVVVLSLAFMGIGVLVGLAAAFGWCLLAASDVWGEDEWDARDLAFDQELLAMDGE